MELGLVWSWCGAGVETSWSWIGGTLAELVVERSWMMDGTDALVHTCNVDDSFIFKLKQSLVRIIYIYN